MNKQKKKNRRIFPKKKWFNELPPEIKKSTKKGPEDAKNGRVTPHAEVIKKYLHWLK